LREIRRRSPLGLARLAAAPSQARYYAPPVNKMSPRASGRPLAPGTPGEGDRTGGIRDRDCLDRRRDVRSHRTTPVVPTTRSALHRVIEHDAEAGSSRLRILAWLGIRSWPCAAWQRAAPEPVSPHARRAELPYSPPALRRRNTAPTPRRALAASRTGPPAVRRLDLVADRVRERHLPNLTRGVRLFSAPI
jgi:hypothetical protein